MNNLQTGYVSPHDHCVFEIFFETVFSYKLYTHVLDNIYDEIFHDRRDCYYEEEYKDGKLVYHPPPSNEVWITYPERCDWIDNFIQHHRRAEEKEHINQAHIPDINPFNRNNAPTLEEVVILYDESGSDDDFPEPVAELEGDDYLTVGNDANKMTYIAPTVPIDGARYGCVPAKEYPPARW